MSQEQDWVEIRIRTDNGYADTVSDVLEALGALAVTYEDAADSPILEPRPGERRLWPNTEVTGLYAKGTDGEEILSKLKQLMGDHLPMTVVKVQDKNWIRAWMDQFKPMKFGRRLWICPSWLKVTERGSIVVMLDPGLAFGTGTHPTTAQCLTFLDGLDLKDKTVVDYGCGSGILGIAALKLGAKCVTGVDIDEQALTATLDNATRNGVQDKITLQNGTRGVTAEPAEVTVANILAGPLAELEPVIASLTKPGGDLALSGILLEQADEVLEAYKDDFEIKLAGSREGWALITGIRR